MPTAALLRRLTMTRDGAPVTVLREAVEITLTYGAADLVLADGSELRPQDLVPFVVRRDGRLGILREVRRAEGTVTFATPLVGVVGLGVVRPGASLPAPETVAALEDVNADGSLTSSISSPSLARSVCLGVPRRSAT